MRWFVQEAGAEHRGGQTWDDAVGLQTALDRAERGDEIWVATGTYFIDPDGLDCMATLSLKNGVAIYGGFAGTETDLADRTVGVCPSILHGGGVAYHVVTSIANDETTRLDGFTIVGGNAHGDAPHDRGGGIVVTGGSTAQFHHLVVIANAAHGTDRHGNGGGVAVDSSAPLFQSCRIIYNRADHRGGGAYLLGSRALFNDCVIDNNCAYEGGGVVNILSAPLFVRCQICNNMAMLNGQGGGVYNSSSSPTFETLLLSMNTANHGGGMASTNSSPVLINVSITGNEATDTGGGIASTTSTVSVINGLVSGNRASVGGGIVNGFYGRYTYVNVTVSANVATGVAGGIYHQNGENSRTSGLFVNVVVWGNSTDVVMVAEDDSLVWDHSLVCGFDLGGTNLPGDTDPQFVAPLAPGRTPCGNYRIQATSPLRGIGRMDIVRSQRDLDGHPRIADGQVDLGPYQWIPSQAACDSPE